MQTPKAVHSLDLRPVGPLSPASITLGLSGNPREGGGYTGIRSRACWASSRLETLADLPCCSWDAAPRKAVNVKEEPRSFGTELGQKEREVVKKKKIMTRFSTLLNVALI